MFKEILLQKQSLTRYYQNQFSRSIRLEGSGIDLGAKSMNAPYYNFLDMSRVTHMTFVDYYSSGEDIVQMDLEQEILAEDNSFDFVIAFNLLEHIYDFQSLMKEIFRVLKPGGIVHIITPFLHKYHPDPNDYWRFTTAAMEKSLLLSGFSNSVEARPISGGRFQALATGLPLPNPLYALSCSLLLFLDWLENRFGSDKSIWYPHSIYATAKK